jgi:translation initiation factor 2 alpha subunit (eIF-2alpha)
MENKDKKMLKHLRKKMLANIEKDFKEIESLGIDLLFEYATTIEHLKSISDDDFETLKDTIIKVDLVS